MWLYNCDRFGLMEDQQVNLSTTFPFCFYGSESDEEIEDGHEEKNLNGNGDSNCNEIQPTFNELGLCYTINNLEQGFNGR